MFWLFLQPAAALCQVIYDLEKCSWCWWGFHTVAPVLRQTFLPRTCIHYFISEAAGARYTPLGHGSSDIRHGTVISSDVNREQEVSCCCDQECIA